MRGAWIALLIAFVGSSCLAEPPANKSSGEGRSRPARPRRLVFGQSDQLPPGAIKRLGSTGYHNSSEDVDAQIAFSDAKTIRTVGTGQIGTCPVETGAYTALFVGTGAYTGSGPPAVEPGFSLARDGRTAAFADYEPVIVVYDTETGDKLHEIPVKHMAHPVALSSDGALLAYTDVPKGAIRHNWTASEEKSKEFFLIVLEVASRKELLRVKVEPASTSRLAFSPDKRTLLICEEGTVRVWDIGSRKELKRVKAPASFSISDVAVSPDGRILAAGAMSSSNGFKSDGLILTWDIATGKQLWRGDEPGYAVIAVAFSPDGKRLASGAVKSFQEGGVLRIRDVSSGKSLATVENKTASSANCLAFDRSGKQLASAGSDHNIHIWDATSGVELHARRGHQGRVSGLAFYAHGRLLLSVSQVDGTVRVWDVATSRELHVFRATEGALLDGAISHDGKMAATCGDRFVVLWDMATGQQLWKLSVPPAKPGVAAYLVGPDFSFDGSVLRAMSIETPESEDFHAALGDQSGTHTARLAWAVSTGKAIAQGPGGTYVAIAGSTDGRTTVSRTGSVFDAASGTELFKLYPEGPSHMSYNGNFVSFSWDSRCVAGWSSSQPDGHIVDNVWEVATGGVMRTVEGNHQAKSLAFSPDGRVVAGHTGSQVMLWDTVSDKVVQRLADPRCSSLAFAPDGRMLASGQDDGTIILWRTDPSRWQNADADPLKLKELESNWADLASPDAHVGQLAVRSLVESPAEAVPFLKEQMKPGEAVHPAKIRQLVSEMDSANFSVRDKAFQQLRTLGGCAEPALREYLAKNPSAEVAERVRSLLRDLLRVHSPDELRCLRGIQVLETIGSAEARAILQMLAAKAAPPRERDDAAASLERLSDCMLFPAAPVHVRAEDVEAARRIIDKALRAHGGAATLAQLKAVTGESTVKMYLFPSETMEFILEFASQPPEREWSSSRIKHKDGKESPTIDARDGDRGWWVMGNSRGRISPENRGEVRERAYAAWIEMLYPLADKTIPVASLGRFQVEGRPASGVVVMGKGHRPIKLFFDEETGLLVKVETRAEESQGGEATYEQIYADFKTFDGVKCATRIKSFKDAKLTGESHVIRMKRTDKLDDKLFVEPP